MIANVRRRAASVAGSADIRSRMNEMKRRVYAPGP
jgi:hypothetical protein